MPSGRPSKAQKEREARVEAQFKNDPEPEIDFHATWQQIATELTMSRAQKLVSVPVKAAIIRMIMHKGTTPRIAAEKENISEKAFINSLRKPHVILLRKMIFDALRKGWAEQALITFVDVMNGNEKAGDKMRAAEFLAGIEGIAPTKRQEIQHHSAPTSLGIQIVLPSLPSSQSQGDKSAALDSLSSAIDGQAIEIKGLVGKK